jgi:hypothetical protein
VAKNPMNSGNQTGTNQFRNKKGLAKKQSRHQLTKALISGFCILRKITGGKSEK